MPVYCATSYMTTLYINCWRDSDLKLFCLHADLTTSMNNHYVIVYERGE